MKITIWRNSGKGISFTDQDFAYIEVDGKTVWNVAALQEQNKTAVALLNELSMVAGHGNSLDAAKVAEIVKRWAHARSLPLPTSSPQSPQ